jgi:hypothetical protein
MLSSDRLMLFVTLYVLQHFHIFHGCTDKTNMLSTDNEGTPLLGLAGLGLLVDEAKVTSEITSEWRR